MPTQAELKQLNETLFDQLADPMMKKQAVDAVNDFTRTTMREDGFARKILPPVDIGNDELDRAVDTDQPQKIVDREPGNPPAISLPFGSLPINVYIYGQRYRVSFDRIVSPRFMKDVDELRTYVMDIRQVLSDNSVKDMLAEEDSKFISAINAVMLGPDTPVPHNGNVVQWETIEGGITRETIQDARKIMPRGPSHLEAHTALINNVTIKEAEKMGFDEMGGDFSQDVFRNGWAEVQFANLNWIITIKRTLVPDDTMFMFSDPKFIGKMYMLEDSTMFMERRAFMIEWFCYQTMGGSIGHGGGLARVDFA